MYLYYAIPYSKKKKGYAEAYWPSVCKKVCCSSAFEKVLQCENLAVEKKNEVYDRANKEKEKPACFCVLMLAIRSLKQWPLY